MHPAVKGQSSLFGQFAFDQLARLERDATAVNVMFMMTAVLTRRYHYHAQ